MKITYCGHSCFILESGGFKAVLDPFKDVPGYNNINLTANAVYCSHSHYDHAYTDGVKITECGVANPFAVTEIKGWHDDANGSLRGDNTIRVFEAEGIKCAHFGDIGCMPEAKDIEKLKGLDAVLIPVGGFYTMQPDKVKELLDIIKPHTIVPMHYRTDCGRGYETIENIKVFASFYNNVLYSDSAELNLAVAPAGVVILKMQN